MDIASIVVHSSNHSIIYKNSLNYAVAKIKKSQHYNKYWLIDIHNVFQIILRCLRYRSNSHLSERYRSNLAALGFVL